MIFRFSFLVLVSVAAFAVSRINITCSRKRNSSVKNSENDDSRFQQEQIEEEEKSKFEDSNVEPKQEEKEVKSARNKNKHGLKPNDPEKSDCTKFELPIPIHDRKWDDDNEIELLKNVVKEREQRRVTLQEKLLNLYGLKEKQFIDIAQLQNHLKAKMTEIDMLNVTVNALQAEREKLRGEIRHSMLVEKQLEVAKMRISEMQAKMCVDAAQMKGQLMMLKEQVFVLQMEGKCTRGVKVEKKLKGMKDVELKIMKMMRRNKKLQLEKRELAIKLAAAQARITALSNMTQSKIIAEMEKEMSSLSLANENLTKQAERLQKYRFGMIEELVYQRWLNTCLRIELQSYKTPLQRTSKGSLSKNSSSDSSKKIKLPLLDFSSESISSQASSSERDKITSTTSESSSSRQRRVQKKQSLIQNIKRWGRREDDSVAILSSDKSPMSKKGLLRRFSMSMVPLKTSMLKNKGDNTVITPLQGLTPSFQRKRKVSFNDSIQTVASMFEDLPKSVEGVLDDEQMNPERLDDSAIVNESDGSSVGLEEEEPRLSSFKFNDRESDGSSNQNRQVIENKEVEIQAVGKINETVCTGDLPSGMPNVPPSERKVEAQMVHIIVAFFIFILMFYLILFNGGTF